MSYQKRGDSSRMGFLRLNGHSKDSCMAGDIDAAGLDPAPQVIKVATPLMSSPPGSEEDIKPLEKLISEAYQEIDKAVVKGILHKNNAARKKARVARYKRMVLISAGLFKPSQDHPDYAAYQRIQVRV
jgi:hypothetical protein